VQLCDRLLVVALVELGTPLAASLSLGVSQAHAASVNMGILNILERHAWNEAGRLPRLADLAVQLVDLLERQTLGLVDHGPGEEDTDEAASAPDEEDLGTEVGVARSVVDHVGRSIADSEVEEPVGGGGHREGLGADLEREDLAGNHPGDRTPGAGEEEDVDADKCDERLLSGLVVDTSDGSSDGDNELADSHADGAKEEEVAATPLLDEVETGEGRANIDSGRDHSDGEGVAKAGILEERGSVCGELVYVSHTFRTYTPTVENEVDTSKLLERLE
jgi:hypothetical protein